MGQHLKNIGQSYFTHFKEAIKFSGKAFKAGFILAIHAISPDTFEKNGGICVAELNREIQSKYQQRQ